MAVKSTGGILKLAGRSFLGGAMSDSLGIGVTSGSEGGLWRCHFPPPQNVRNCMICPDLFRKIMFSNHSSLTGGSKIRKSFLYIFSLLRI